MSAGYENTPERTPLATTATPARRLRPRLLAVAITQAVALYAARTSAATLTVTSNADAGPGTLREAIASAADGDVITFGPALNGATIATNSELSIDSLDITIDGDLDDDGEADVTLTTSGHAEHLIDIGSGADVILDGLAIEDADNSAIQIDDATLTLRNSTISGSLSGGEGGAIRADYASVTIEDSLITGNAAYDEGGAVFAKYSTLSISRSTLSSNASIDDEGGAIYAVNSAVTIEESTLSGNTAARNGGAIYAFALFGYSSTLDISDSTLAGNTSSDIGGAVIHYAVEYADATTTITDSTISGNEAKYGGGVSAASLEYGSAATTITRSTLSGNSAIGGASALHGLAVKYGSTAFTVRDSTISGNTVSEVVQTIKYGAVGMLGVDYFLAEEYSAPSTVTLSVANSTISGNAGAGIIIGTYGDYSTAGATIQNSTIVANNTGDAPEVGEIMAFAIDSLLLTAPSTFDVRNSVIGNEDNAACKYLNGGDDDFAAAVLVGNDNNFFSDDTCDGSEPLNGGNPEITPLANNGGPTQTHAPLPGSPLIDAGDNGEAAGLDNDQRGAGYPRIHDGTVDIGAVEFQLDNDGIPPDTEAGVDDPDGGGSGDGNGDGTPDNVQDDVTSLPISGGSDYATLDASAADDLLLSMVESVPVPAGAPDGLVLPYGAFSFRASGVSGTLELSLFVPANDDITGYWKPDVNGDWADIATAVTTVGNKTRIDISIEDNGPFDFNDEVGVVEDPGGPGFFGGLAEPIPALPRWLQVVLGGFVGLTGLGALRARRAAGRGRR
jgi:hypothetical protein